MSADTLRGVPLPRRGYDIPGQRARPTGVGSSRLTMVSLSPWLVAALFAPAGLALLGALASRGVERARERARHAALLAGLGAPLGKDALASLAPESVATLAGTLARTSPDLITFHPFGTSLLDEPNVYAATHVAGEQEVEVELEAGGRVIIESALQVLVGSTETEHMAPLERASDVGAEALAKARVGKRVGQFRVLRAGDRVRLRGVVSPAPDDDALYRERGRTFRVAAEDAHEPGVPRAVLIAATSPVSARRITAPRLERAVLAGALGLGVVSATLLAMRPAAPRDAGVAASANASVPSACRKAVLERLEKNDPGAMAAARACADPYARGLASFAEGAFTDASAALSEARLREPELAPSLTEAEAHLFAHDFARAASTVRVMVDRFYPGPETAEKRYLECIVGVLDARAGQAEGGPGPISHNTWMGTKYRKICSPRDFAAFARELDAEGTYFGAEDMKAWQQRDYAKAGAYDVVGTPFTAPLATRARLAARPIALEKHLVDRLILTPAPRDAHPQRGEPAPDFGRLNAFHMEGPAAQYTWMTGFAADVALFYAFSGVPERSARYWPILDGVAGRLESGAPFYKPESDTANDKKLVEAEETFLSYVMSLGASAALASRDLVRTQRYAKLGEVHSASIIRQLAGALEPGAAWEIPRGDGAWPEHKAIFDAGLSGDGAKVVQALVAQGSTGRDTLARALPHVRTNRAALDAWFVQSFPAPCLTCGASSLHGHLADRRDVARLLGGAAAREQDRSLPALTRFTDALTDPAIAFELDELETFFAARR